MAIEAHHTNFVTLEPTAYWPVTVTEADARSRAGTTRKLMHCAMSLALSAGTLPATTAQELGPHYRSAMAFGLYDPNFVESYVAEPNRVPLPTVIGELQRDPQTVVIPRKLAEVVLDEKKDNSADAISFDIVQQFRNRYGDHKRTVSRWIGAKEGESKQDLPLLYRQSPTPSQIDVDQLGVRPKDNKSIYLPVPPTGKSWLWIRAAITNNGKKERRGARYVLPQMVQNKCDGVALVRQDKASPYALSELCDAYRAISPFMKKPDIKIMLGNEARNFYQNPPDGSEQTINMALPFPRDIEAYNTGASIAKHELTHALFTGLPLADRLQLFEHHQKLERHMQYRYPTGDESLRDDYRFYDIADNEPIWGIVTESTYLRELGNDFSLAGHPYSNATELLASSITVYSTFPDKHIEKFWELPPSYQKTHRALFEDIVRILGRANNDPKALQRLIPVEKIRAGIAEACLAPATRQ